MPLLGRVPLSGNSRHHRGGDLGGEHGVAVRDARDGLDDLLHRAVLREEPDGAGAQRLDAQRVLVVHREHEDLGLAGSGVDAAGRLDAVEHRHGDVHHHDLGLEQRDEADGFFTVAGLGHDVEARLLERAAQRLAQQLMVIGDQDTGHCGYLQLDEHGCAAFGFADKGDLRADGVSALTDADEPVALAGHRVGVHAASVVSNFELRSAITNPPADPCVRGIGMSFNVREGFLEDPPELLLHLHGNPPAAGLRDESVVDPGAAGPAGDVVLRHVDQILVLADGRPELVQRFAQLGDDAADDALQVLQLRVVAVRRPPAGRARSRRRRATGRRCRAGHGRCGRVRPRRRGCAAGRTSGRCRPRARATTRGRRSRLASSSVYLFGVACARSTRDRRRGRGRATRWRARCCVSAPHAAFDPGVRSFARTTPSVRERVLERDRQLFGSSVAGGVRLPRARRARRRTCRRGRARPRPSSRRARGTSPART